MNIILKFDHEEIKFNVPDKNYLETICPAYTPGVKNPEREVEKSLNKPIESQKLMALAKNKKNIVILASDITRPAPSHILLPPILKELYQAGISNQQITIIFGLGIHRKQTEEEMKKVVSEEIFNKINCIDHDIKDCKYIGTTSRGTKVSINEKVLNADLLIATGNLEFHYYAGFSGGAKALAPGVASKETIKDNHQFSLDSEAKSGIITGNPVREDIEEIGEMVGIDYMVNAVLNNNKEIVKVVSGDIIKAHRKGVSFIKDIFQVKIKNLADIIIVSPGGYPKDIDLYQTHKAIENAKSAIKEDGIIIAVGGCTDGLGEKKFACAMQRKDSFKSLISEIQSDFVLGKHKAARIAQIQARNDVYLVSKLNDSIKESLFIKTFTNIEKALNKALEIKGNKAKISIIPYGNSTFPIKT